MQSKILFGLTACIILSIFSCKKNSLVIADTNFSEPLFSIVPQDSIIVGKWNLLTDSSFTGVGSNNHPLNYTGQAGDYFDFREDGMLYTKEGVTLDTLSYEVTSDSTMVIGAFGIILNGNAEERQLLNLTAHSITINAPVALTPGGEFGRKVTLNR